MLTWVGCVAPASGVSSPSTLPAETEPLLDDPATLQAFEQLRLQREMIIQAVDQAEPTALHGSPESDTMSHAARHAVVQYPDMDTMTEAGGWSSAKHVPNFDNR